MRARGGGGQRVSGASLAAGWLLATLAAAARRSSPQAARAARARGARRARRRRTGVSVPAASPGGKPAASELDPVEALCFPAARAAAAAAALGGMEARPAEADGGHCGQTGPGGGLEALCRQAAWLRPAGSAD